ncbi:hypothetical protein EYF80_000982 [Liparis tanakae]|uniref:Uncharacterized protein n=1 Tax=Liparis tanakae TaxID=230148 RepID=A0A4Z2JEP7_9TELE|nr:hypothetical protein EYF80_000982 [Liparis tanakae]
MEMCWSGTMGSVLRYQLMVYSGVPSTVQVKNRVLLMPVFRFLGDKVTDGQPRQTPCPAGIRGQRATIFQPTHGGTRVPSRRAGELDTLACVHLPCLKTVQDGGRGLVGVWRAEMG